MTRPLLPILIAGTLLLAGVLPVATAREHKEEEQREPREERPAGEDRPSAEERPPGEERAQGGDRGASGDAPGQTRRAERELTEAEIESMRPGPAVGAFRMERNGRIAHGHHVSFAFNDTGVQGFTAAGVQLFDLRVEGAPEPRDAGRGPQVGGEGSAFDLRTATFRFRAHDNPGAVAKLDADGAASLTFAAGTRLVEASDRRVDFVVGSVSGSVRAEDIRLQGQTVLVSDGDALVFLHQSRGAFDRHREDVDHAIGKGHVGAEATIGKRPGLDDIVQDVVSYGNVTMRTLKAERGNLTVEIEGHGTEGRVLVLNVDGRVVGAQRSEDLTIVMDNLTIGPAADLQDVLDPENDGFLPEYHVVFDPATESFQLLVSVPHYSVHVLSVMTPIPLPAPSVVVGILAGVALLVPGGYVLFRRKE